MLPEGTEATATATVTTAATAAHEAEEHGLHSGPLRIPPQHVLIHCGGQTGSVTGVVEGIHHLARPHLATVIRAHVHQHVQLCTTDLFVGDPPHLTTHQIKRPQ